MQSCSALSLPPTHTCAQMQEHAGSRECAAGYRERLLSFLQSTGARVPEDTCGACLDPLLMATPSESGKELIMLACLHCLHDE